MPPEKRLQHSLKVGFTAFEYFALQWLQEVAGGSMADLVRLAVVAEVRRLPQDVRSKLRAAAERQAKAIANTDDRRLFEKQVDRVLAVGSEPKRPRSDPDASRTGVDAVGPVHSSDDDFPRD